MIHQPKRVRPLFETSGRFKEDSPNKTFCMAPFTHTYISPQSERRLCCASREEASYIRQYIDSGSGENTSTGYAPKTLEEHWNSDALKKVRLAHMAGEVIPECMVCNDRILNIDVYRNWFNHLFHEKVDEVFAATDDTGHLSLPVISFDYRINNLCNFKCRMCGHQLSSSWEAEKRKHDEWSPIYDPWMVPEMKAQIEEFQTGTVEVELADACKQGIVEELYWVGGEPLMWEKHWELMHHMVESGHSKNVYARYNTNLSRIDWKGVNLFKDILPHYKNYLMCCSIDATGRVGEYIRTGLNWDEWLVNFKAGLEVPELRDRMKLDLTLTLPGLLHMKEFFDLANELDVDILTKIVYAFDPEKLVSPFALPRKVLDDVLDDLLCYMEPKVNHRTQTLVTTLQDMRTRPTFEEQFPDRYEEAFYKGREFLQRLARHRGDGQNGRITIEQIFEPYPDVLRWWMKN
jgi:hypothetical protein